VYFDSLAIATGVDAKRWRDCVRDRHVRRVVDADMARGVNIGVRSTPTFFVGDQAIAGAMPIDTFRLYINRQLAKASGRRP